MRILEIIVALVIGLALFIGLKVIGLVLKFAIIVTLFGMVLGFFVARAFRSRRES